MLSYKIGYTRYVATVFPRYMETYFPDESQCDLRIHGHINQARTHHATHAPPTRSECKQQRKFQICPSGKIAPSFRQTSKKVNIKNKSKGLMTTTQSNDEKRHPSTQTQAYTAYLRHPRRRLWPSRQPPHTHTHLRARFPSRCPYRYGAPGTPRPV